MRLLVSVMQQPRRENSSKRGGASLGGVEYGVLRDVGWSVVGRGERHRRHGGGLPPGAPRHFYRRPGRAPL
jgi:hypothetical protein